MCARACLLVFVCVKQLSVAINPCFICSFCTRFEADEAKSRFGSFLDLNEACCIYIYTCI